MIKTLRQITAFTLQLNIGVSSRSQTTLPTHIGFWTQSHQVQHPTTPPDSQLGSDPCSKLHLQISTACADANFTEVCLWSHFPTQTLTTVIFLSLWDSYPIIFKCNCKCFCSLIKSLISNLSDGWCQQWQWTIATDDDNDDDDDSDKLSDSGIIKTNVANIRKIQTPINLKAAEEII